MTALKTRTIIANLKKKGFIERNGDHEFLYFYNNGKKTIIKTKISHGETEVGNKLIGSMAKQLKLDISDFIKFAQCHINQEQYVNILKRKGIL